MEPHSRQQPSQSQPQALPYATASYPTSFDPASYQQQPIMYPPMLQFSASGPAAPASHPQQQHIQQLNMRHALFQSAIAQQQQRQPQQADVIMSPNGSKRIQSKAERRAEHNAIERARRESLNSKFQQLAHALPNLQNDRRPSKGTIIERTLDYVRTTMVQEERYQRQILFLLKENRRMKRQLKKRREASSTETCSVSSSEHDDLFMASSAFLGWESTLPPAISQPHQMTMAPAPSHSMYIPPPTAPPPAFAHNNGCSPAGATLSYCDDDDDSDSASCTQVPVDSYPMTMAMMGVTGNGSEYMKVMHPEYQVKMEPSRQHQ